MYRAIYDEKYENIVGAIDDNHQYIKIDDVDAEAEVLEFTDIQKVEARQLKATSSVEESQKAFNDAIQTHLDVRAREFRYDSMMSARSYAGYANPFQDEAQILAVWASNCWVKAGEIKMAVQAGDRPMPTVKDVITELPRYEPAS